MIWIGHNSWWLVAISLWLLCQQLVTEIYTRLVKLRWYFPSLSCSWELLSFHLLWEISVQLVKNNLKKWGILIKKEIWMISWFQFNDLKVDNLSKSHSKLPLRSTLTISGLMTESIFSRVSQLINNYCQKQSKKTWSPSTYSKTCLLRSIDSSITILWITKSCSVTFRMDSCRGFSLQPKMIVLYTMKIRRCQNCTSFMKVLLVLDFL